MPHARLAVGVGDQYLMAAPNLSNVDPSARKSIRPPSLSVERALSISRPRGNERTNPNPEAASQLLLLL